MDRAPTGDVLSAVRRRGKENWEMVRDPRISPIHRLPVTLNREEVLGLMEMCLLSKVEDDPIKEGVLTKLGDLYRHLQQWNVQLLAIP